MHSLNASFPQDGGMTHLSQIPRLPLFPSTPRRRASGTHLNSCMSAVALPALLPGGRVLGRRGQKSSCDIYLQLRKNGWPNKNIHGIGSPMDIIFECLLTINILLFLKVRDFRILCGKIS